jgi:hypothetical protein
MMWLERRMSAGIKAQLLHGPYSFLPAIARVQGSPAILDLRFRGARDGDAVAGDATLYFGERAAARLRVSGKGGVSLTGPAKPLAAPTREGLIEARYCACPWNAVLDRQTAFNFPAASERTSVLGTLAAPLEALIGPLKAELGLAGGPKLGQEIDAIAIDADGALAIVEIKDGSYVPGVAWAPIQVAMYARIMRHWIDSDAAATAVLKAMLQDRVTLGLSVARELAVPIRLRPVVAIGLPFAQEHEGAAMPKALSVAQALDAAGLGENACEFRGIAPVGTASGLW